MSTIAAFGDWSMNAIAAGTHHVAIVVLIFLLIVLIAILVGIATVYLMLLAKPHCPLRNTLATRPSIIFPELGSISVLCILRLGLISISFTAIAIVVIVVSYIHHIESFACTCYLLCRSSSCRSSHSGLFLVVYKVERMIIKLGWDAFHATWDCIQLPLTSEA